MDSRDGVITMHEYAQQTAADMMRLLPYYFKEQIIEFTDNRLWTEVTLKTDGQFLLKDFIGKANNVMGFKMLIWNKNNETNKYKAVMYTISEKLGNTVLVLYPSSFGLLELVTVMSFDSIEDEFNFLSHTLAHESDKENTYVIKATEWRKLIKDFL